jgi:stage II sporulation protein D
MRKRWKTLLLAASLFSLSIPSPHAAVDAAGKNIRVALFIDNGQGYRNVVPSVTLTSESGLEITLADENGSTGLPDLSDETVRFGVDQYYFVVRETYNLIEAQQTAQQLSQRKIDASIQVEQRGGTPVYLVVSGSYGSAQTAAGQAHAIVQAANMQPVLKGAFHLEAKKFSSLREAQEWEKAFELAGIPAHTVLLPQKRKTEYAVWIGDETSAQALRSVEAAAKSKFPDFSYKQPSAESYVIMKKEALAGGNGQTVWKYVFSPKAKLIVAPEKGRGTPVIEVEERESRKYRGKIELSQYKGNLAVINELPLEQYLYGVVGSEMAAGWPMEALKTQAVLARTRAVSQGNKYGIANVSDTVLEQAYYGYTREAKDIREAVDETAGEVITYKGKVIEPYFYSNAGGMTADGTEVWGNPVPYAKPVESNDAGPMLAAKTWYRAALQDGSIGYIRSDFLTFTGELNPMGLKMAVTNSDNLNFRAGPSTSYHRVLSTLPAGTLVTVIDQEQEENAFSWTRGPYTPEEITAMINASQERNQAPRFQSPIQSLKVTKRGPSGRVLQMEADGRVLASPSPDAHRSIFRQGDSILRSTKFDVEEMGTFTVLAAGGQQISYPAAGFQLQAIGAAYAEPLPANGFSDQFLLYSGKGQWRVASKHQAFLLRGSGFGHGLGVSQFGAKAMAEEGYDYKKILKHYYSGIKIER